MSSERHPRNVATVSRPHGRELGEWNGAVQSLMTVAEVGVLLRASKKAIYAMIERNQLPGIIRINRRVLVDQNVLLDWLRQKSSSSLER